MSLATLLVTDQSRSGIAVDFLYPEYRNVTTGKIISHKLALPAEGDTPVHPFEWDPLNYPCPDFLSAACDREGSAAAAALVDVAILQARDAAAALHAPNEDWENVRYTSWRYYETLTALAKVVETQSTIYDRKDAIMYLIGKRAGESFFNVCVAWVLRAARQHRVSVATTVRRWKEAAGLFDELLQEPLGKETEVLQLSADCCRLMSVVCLATSIEATVQFYLADTQRVHAQVLEGLHHTHYLYCLAQAICQNSAAIPQPEEWINFLQVKVEYYMGMVYYVASLEPGIRVGDSRRRRAVECFSSALSIAQDTPLAAQRSCAVAEMSMYYNRCSHFRSLSQKGKIPEAAQRPVSFRYVDDTCEGGLFAAPPLEKEEFVPLHPGVDVLRSSTRVTSSESEARAAGVMSGQYRVDDGWMSLDVAMVQEDLRRCPTVAVRFGSEPLLSGTPATDAQKNISDTETQQAEKVVAESDAPSPHAATVAADGATDLAVAAAADSSGAEDGYTAADPPLILDDPATSPVTSRPPPLDMQLSGELLTSAEHSPSIHDNKSDRPLPSHDDGGAALRDDASSSAVSKTTSPRKQAAADLRAVAAMGATPCHVVSVALSARSMMEQLSSSNSDLRCSPCAMIFLVDLCSEDKNEQEKLRSSVISSIQSGRWADGDRIGVVEFDSVHATPSVVMFDTTEVGQKKLFQRILRQKGRGKFEGSNGTPIVAAVVAAADALRELGAPYDENSHIFIASNGGDRTAYSDSEDWSLWSTASTRKAITAQGVEVHCAAVSFSADDVLLSSLSQHTNGRCQRILVPQSSTAGDEEALEIQKVVVAAIATSNARVASGVSLRVRCHGASAADTTAVAVRLLSVEQNDVLFDREEMSSAVLAPIQAASVVVPLPPFSVGCSSTALATFVVPQSFALRDIIYLGDAVLTYNVGGVSKSLTCALIHVNTTRLVDGLLHDYIPQLVAHQSTGDVVLVAPTGETTRIRGQETVCAGNVVRTGNDGYVSLLSANGIRLDVAPRSEVRIDEVHRLSVVCHVQLGQLAAATPMGTTVECTAPGYRCTVDESSRLHLFYTDVDLNAKTIVGRAVLRREVNQSAENESAVPAATELHSVSHQQFESKETELLMSRQTIARNNETGQLPFPWLMSISEEERELMTGASNGNTVDNKSLTESALSSTAEVVFDSISQLRCKIVLETFRSRLDMISLLDVMIRKLSNRLCVASRDQRQMTQRARMFMMNHLLTATRGRLANSIAYICENAVLDSWRQGMEYASRLVTAVAPHPSLSRASGKNSSSTTAASGLTGMEETLQWSSVFEVVQMRRALSLERSLFASVSIGAPRLFATHDMDQQLERLESDRELRKNAARQLRLEEQIANRQTEEHRREVALVRLFQCFQWDGIASAVWIRDILSVIASLPQSKIYTTLLQQAQRVFAAIGLRKSLSDEQFATCMETLLADFSQAEFTITVSTMAKRCYDAQVLIEASLLSRATFALIRAMDKDCSGTFSMLEIQDAIVKQETNKYTSVVASARLDKILETTVLQTARSKYLEYAEERLQVVLRRKSTAALLARPKGASPAPSTSVILEDAVDGTDAQQQTLFVVPDDFCADASTLLTARMSSILVMLPALVSYFESLDFAEAMRQLNQLYATADASASKQRDFADIIRREATQTEIRHLQQWEQRHVLDGAAWKECRAAVSPTFALPPHIKTPLHVLVAPVIIFLGLSAPLRPNKVALFDAEPAGAKTSAGMWDSVQAASGSALSESQLEYALKEAAENFWPAITARLTPETYDTFREQLAHFSPLCISHRALQHAANFLQHDDLDPEVLSAISPVLAGLARWVLLMLRLVYLQHDFDGLQRSIPQKLMSYMQSRALKFPQEASPSLSIVAASQRPSSRNSSPGSRNTSPQRGVVGPPATGALTPSRPSSGRGVSGRVMAEVSPRIAAAAMYVGAPALPASQSRFATEGPHPPSFSQRLSARPSTAGTMRQGFHEDGPLPAVVGRPQKSMTAALPGSKFRPSTAIQGGHNNVPARQSAGSAWIPSDFAEEAERSLQQRSVGVSQTVMRPQSAYIRGASAARALHSSLGPSQRAGTLVSSHQFFGDVSSVAPGTPNFRSSGNDTSKLQLN